MIRSVCTLLLFCLVVPAWGQQTETDLQLTLPPEIYVVPGVPTNIYFDNIVLTQSPDKYRFDVVCDFGQSEQHHWTWTPTAGDVGVYPIRVDLYSADDTLLDSAASVLRVTAGAASPSTEPIRILIIGDSLTHASAYPNEIARLMTEDAKQPWKMLGTHKPASAAADVAHEGYGGWTWWNFVNKYEPNPDGTHRKRSSPFVFLNDESKPVLDMPRYFKEQCDGQLPDYVVIKLGINDLFSAPAGDVVGTDAKIDTVFGYADQLVAAIRAAAPNATIGICLTTPPNARQEAFEANYKGRYLRWGWKQIQHQLVQRQMQYIADKSDPQILIVPTQLNLDPVDGYPDNNSVHPNKSGYQQIGSSIYAWLQHQLAGKSPAPAAK
ncbi:SGNH/GDSL hydrolase family protein [Rosistilla oblonga]|uniref:SGNH/GDSL hydrolase family protein n=1 Tax=Rosistilla oblonga TaxID=2527990 RepID=UPI003A969BC0